MEKGQGSDAGKHGGVAYVMRSIEDYFELALDDEDLALTRLLTFSARHLGRLSVRNPGGVFNSNIAALTTALSQLRSAVTDEGVRKGILRGRLQAKRAIRKQIPVQLRRIYGAVAHVYGDPSPEMTECFPKGRRVFHGRKDGDVAHRLAALVAALANKSVPADVKTLAASLLSDWSAVYGAQLEADTKRNFTAAERRARRRALVMELQRSILSVALQFPGDRKASRYYFPEYMLYRRKSRVKPQPAPTPAPPIEGTGA